MGESTKIQWCHHTFNPWYGCRKVAPECWNCYITRTPPFRMRGLKHGPERIKASDKAWQQPHKWNRAAVKAGERRRVFCLSLGDWLDDEAPIEWLADLLAVIHATPHLAWLLLTKRPQNWAERMNAVISGRLDSCGIASDWFTGESPPHNVWIGVSAGANQQAALDIPAKIHFLSCEPMLHAIDGTHLAQFSWVIIGGESGPNARECGLGWIRDSKVKCQELGVPVFVKQLGANIASGGTLPTRLKDSHGGDMSEWPEDLRVREFPKV